MPPLISDEMDTFNEKKNPSYNYADSKLWLAYKNNELVGRVAGIYHKPEFEEKKLVRFGWIDFIDDHEVSLALVDAVSKWAKSLGAEAIHGPLGFNDFDFEGLLVDGFNSLTTIATIYNFEYYRDHLEGIGFESAAEWIELEGQFIDEIEPRLERSANFIKERFKLTPIKLKNSKEIAYWGREMFEVINRSYVDLYGFYTLTPAECDAFVKKYLSYVRPSSLSFIKNEKDDLIGFAVTIPSLSKAFQKAKGRLFPFGIFHIVKALLFNKNFDLYLVGVDPEYRNSGAIGLIYYELWKSYKNLGLTSIRANPVLVENERMIGLWKSITKSNKLDLDDHIVKRRRCYIKTI